MESRSDKDKASMYSMTWLWGLFALCLLAMLLPPFALAPASLPQDLAPAGSPVVALPDHPPEALILAIGFAIGCYGTIVGIGGGPLILPTMLFFYGWEPEILVASSLFIVFLNAFSGSMAYYRQKRIDYIGGAKYALAAIPFAVLFSFVHHLFMVEAFDIIFGVFLLLLAGYSFKKARDRHLAISSEKVVIVKPHFRELHINDSFGKKYHFYVNDRYGVVVSVFMGSLVGFLGIGGGVLQVPMLIFVLDYPVHVATATSHYITMIVSFVALIPHFYLGNVFLAEAAWMGGGVVLGAQLGAYLAPKIKSSLIVYLFIVILVIFATKLIFRI